MNKPKASVKTQVGKMEEQLKLFGAKLDDLVTKAHDAGAEAKDDYRKTVAELKTKHQAAQAKLDELRAVGIDKWDAFKTGIEGAWSEFETAFKKLTH